MNYRFVKITGFYRDFLTAYYAGNPEIEHKSYRDQHSHLMSQGFGWSDYYSQQLRSLGIQADEIVYNALPLQRQWGYENGVSGTEKEIIIAQLQAMKPDVVFFQDSIKLNGSFVDTLREKVPSIRQTIGFCCSPYGERHLKQFQTFDYMIVCSPHFQMQLGKKGLKTYLLYHAFEASLLTRLEESNPFPDVDFIFLGSLIPGTDGHGIRKKVLDYLLESGINMVIHAHLQKISPSDLAARRISYLIIQLLRRCGLGDIAESLPLINKACSLKEFPRALKNVQLIEQQARPPVYGLEMFKALSRAKVGFNIHGDVGGDYAANVRLFEITGVGSCMVTDWKKNISDLFIPDEEIITYRTSEECVDKVKWLLAHEPERRKIARQGQQKVLARHTFQQRAERLNEIILQNFH